jgi:hypothetical protein
MAHQWQMAIYASFLESAFADAIFRLRLLVLSIIDSIFVIDLPDWRIPSRRSADGITTITLQFQKHTANGIRPLKRPADIEAEWPV